MVGDKELDTGFRCWSCKEFTTLRARIAELEQDLAYFPSTVRSLAETVTEREAEINQLRAELAAIKAKDTVGEVVGWYRLDRPYEMTSYPSVCATWHKLGAPVAPLYAAPVSEAKAQGVVLQELRSFEKWWCSTPILRESKRTIAEKAWLAARLNAASVQQVSVTDGWKLVPVDSTGLMEDAAGIGMEKAREVYQAMLAAAAPAAPAADASHVFYGMDGNHP